MHTQKQLRGSKLIYILDTSSAKLAINVWSILLFSCLLTSCINAQICGSMGS